jgi:hypothetical protein
VLLGRGHQARGDIGLPIPGPAAIEEALFPMGWEQAMDRNLSFIVNRMNERVLAGQSIETLLAVADVRADGHHAGTLARSPRIC